MLKGNLVATGLALLWLGLAASAQQETPPPEPESNERAVVGVLRQILQEQARWAGEHDLKRASLLDLVLARRLPADLQDGQMAGYRFRMTLTANQRGFSVTAIPVEHGRSGRRSFFADHKGVRGEDTGGKPATGKAPLLEEAAK